LQLKQPQSDLHPQLISSEQAFAASGRVIQTGRLRLSSIVQPLPSGSGMV